MTVEAPAWAPFILTVAPNGAHKTREDHPALPITPPELARTAAACAEAGAAMIHLHVRDREGRHTLDVSAYRKAIAAIRREIGECLIIQATSEAAGEYSAQEQMAMVRDLRPEAVSLAIRELIPGLEHEKPAADFLAWAWRERILPQYILYSAHDCMRFDDLVKRGVIPGERQFVLFVLGRYRQDQMSQPRDLLPFLAASRIEFPWAVCAFGAREIACVAAAAALGGHGRVGFENNLWLPDGELAPDNAALVTAAAGAAAAIGRPLANATQARAILAG